MNKIRRLPFLILFVLVFSSICWGQNVGRDELQKQEIFALIDGHDAAKGEGALGLPHS